MTSNAPASGDSFLQLGEPQLDLDHATFARLLTQLAAAANGWSKEVFAQLLVHTEHHFDHEDRMMRNCQYPALAEHEGEHRRVLGQMRQFKERVDRGSIAMARAWVKQTFPEWLKLHTSTMDAALVAHLTKAAQATAKAGEHLTAPAPSVSSAAPQTNDHFTALGGAATIERLVERFYHYMDTLPEARSIRAMHPADLGPVRTVLVRYLTEWTGGPALYSVEKGHPRLRKRHMRFDVGPTERDAWMTCMRRALSEVVADVALRAELDAAFYKVADFIRNDPGHAHVQH